MPVYTYTARDRGGKVLTATMEAATQRDVALALRDKGLFVSEIKAPGAGLRADIKMPAFLDRVGLRDVTIFSRQFATVINAGLPVVQSLSILSRQADKQQMKTALNTVREDVETGSPLSDALAKHKSIFNRLYIYLVRAGEVSGNLDGILERVAAYFEKQAALRGKIRSAMTYPVVVLVIALAVTYFLLTGIVPQFAGILDQLGGELPLLTRILVGISEYLQNFWWLNLIIIVGLVVGIGALLSDEQRQACHRPLLAALAGSRSADPEVGDRQLLEHLRPAAEERREHRRVDRDHEGDGGQRHHRGCSRRDEERGAAWRAGLGDAWPSTRPSTRRS